MTDALNARVAELTASLRAAGREVTFDGYVSAETAAEVTRLSVATLKDYRYNESGPPWEVVNRRVWYRLEDLVAWREKRTRGHNGK